MILWHDLTFWTAVGHLGLGVLVGLTVGFIARETRRLAKAQATSPNAKRMCPSCGARSIRRVRPAAGRRLLGLFARRRVYSCRRCGWSSQSRTMTTSLRVTPVANQPTSSPAAARVVSPMSDRAPAPFRTTPILDGDSLIPRGPERDFDSASVSSDDVAEVKEAVLRYLAMLNAGDVETRAKVYLSESTGFGFDGGMLTAGMEEQAIAADPGQSYDLRCRDLRIYIHKDTAIATGYLVGAVTRMDGPSTRTAGRSTWVLLRQGAEWKLAHTHLSQLSPDALGPSAFQGVEAQRKRPYRAS